MRRKTPIAEELETLGVSAANKAMEKHSKDLQGEVIETLRGKGLSRVKVSRVCEYANRHMISTMKKTSAVRHSHRFVTAKPDAVSRALGHDAEAKVSAYLQAPPRAQGDDMTKLSSSSTTTFRDLIARGAVPQYDPIVKVSAAPAPAAPEGPSLRDRALYLEQQMDLAAEEARIKVSSAEDAIAAVAPHVIQGIQSLLEDRPGTTVGDALVACCAWAQQKVSSRIAGDAGAKEWQRVFAHEVARWVFDSVDTSTANALAKHSSSEASVADITQRMTDCPHLPLPAALTKMASALADRLVWEAARADAVRSVADVRTILVQSHVRTPPGSNG